MATLTEQLDSVQAAITAIEQYGQTVAADGRSLTRADLSVLYRREKDLQNRVSQRAGTSIAGIRFKSL